VAYSRVVPVVVEALKAQPAEIAAQAAQREALEAH